jgi:hypothetical protein
MLRGSLAIVCLAALPLAACSDNQGTATGPGISVHCQAEKRRQLNSSPGIGDTTARITCPNPAEQPVDP